jgi:hypothetical protein
MTQNKNKGQNATLFGLKITNTATVLLFYLILPLMLNSIPFLLYLIANMLEYPSDIFSDPLSFLYLTFFLVIPIVLISLFTYVLVKGFINQKMFREEEGLRVKWFGFRLDNTSLIVLFLLAIFYLILDVRSLVSYINSALIYLRFSLPPETVIIQLYASFILVAITINFHIYSLVICAKNRRIMR